MRATFLLSLCLLETAVAGCAEPLVAIPQGKVECVLDRDCEEGICIAGTCAPPLVADAGPPPDEDAGPPPVEDAGPPPEEDAGPPPMEDAGPPPAEDAGPPPLAPQVLRVTARPETNDPLADCFCAAGVSSANVDLALVAEQGGTCTKPVGALDCGLAEPGCLCSGPGVGTAHWSSDGPALEYRPGERWIANEEIVRQSGPDGALTVRATLIDDCVRSPATRNAEALYGCFLLDCEDYAFTCMDYTVWGYANCPVAIRNYMELMDPIGSDCIERGPAAVRITVETQGDGGFVRQFCTVLSQDEALDAVQLTSLGGRYELASVSAAVTEVPPDTVCPQPQ